MTQASYITFDFTLSLLAISPSTPANKYKMKYRKCDTPHLMWCKLYT